MATSIGTSGMAVFERAMAAMQTEWRRFEVERAEWDVERIRLKAKLSAADKRIEHLGSLYRVSQKHIAVLERLLNEARGGVEQRAVEEPSLEGVSVGEIVDVTQATRQRSRELLSRCLGEIEILLGSSGLAPRTSPMPSPSIADNLRLSAGVTLLKRPVLSAVPNGVIESNVIDSGQTEQMLVGDWQRLASPPSPLYSNIIDGGAAVHSSSSSSSSLDLCLFQRPPLRGGEEEEDEEGEELAISLPPIQAAIEPLAEDLAPEKRPIRKLGDRRRRISLATATAAATAAADGEEEEEKISAHAWGLKKTFVGHLDSVRALSTRDSGDGSGLQMMSGSDDGMVVLWDVSRDSKRKSRRQRSASDVVPAALLRGHLAPVTSVVCASGHAYAYSASLDSSIKVWALDAKDDSLVTCFPVRELARHADAVWALALAPGAELLASVAADGVCCLWGTEPSHADGRPLRATLPQRMGVPTDTCFLPTGDASSLAVSYADGAIDLYSTGESPRLAMSLGNGSTSRIAAIAGAENTLAVACVDGNIRMFDVRTGSANISEFAVSKGPASAVSLSPTDSLLLVSGGSDGVVKWWDRRSLKSPVHKDDAHTPKADEGVCDLRFLPSSSAAVISGGADGVSHLYQQEEEAAV
ncbi:1,2-dihydroxy-3-keto-5-methylthiopentene dioxygenase [Coemansia sp. BCRC 34301]|nr:1,2-dihydroxy-3-keto-5-methylthiopentene dioxygenase [Coemansia sp. BCRC 34301]